MAKRKKHKGVGGFDAPIVIVRTPEQHRAIIQPAKVNPLPVVAEVPKPPKSRKKKARLPKQTGTSSLQARMHLLGYRVYADYLASPHWTDVRSRWRAGNLFKGWVCHSYGCDSKDGLSLHHWTYERLGREELSDLILVCTACHKRIHGMERRGVPLDEATFKVTGQQLRYLPNAAAANAA